MSEKKTVVKKSAAKPAAKPAVKKAAVKPAAKPAVKKAVAKPAAKPVAKKVVAKPAAKPVAKKKDDTVSQVFSIAATTLFELRAENIQSIDLRGINDVADFFLVATCTSEAQMQAILNELSKEFKAQKIKMKGIEYKSGVQWAVFDVGFELMVHLFEEAKREEIQLAALYGHADIKELKEKDFVKKTTKTKAKIEDDLI